MTYDISEKWQIGFWEIMLETNTILYLEDRETNFGTIQQALRLTIFFEGQEVTDFETYFGAISNTYRPNEKLKLTLTTSAFPLFRNRDFRHFRTVFY